MKNKLLGVVVLLLISTTAYSNVQPVQTVQTVQTILCANPVDESTANKIWNIGLSDMVLTHFINTKKCIILK